MRYVPRKSADNPNIAKIRPEIDLIVLVLGFIGLIVTLYILIGLTGYLAVKVWPASTDQLLGKLIEFEQDQNYLKEQKKLQDFVDQIWDKFRDRMPSLSDKPRVVVIKCPAPNAFAAPGGLIAFCHNLLSEFRTENEIVMVLGHELAHLKNRDHISALGSGLFLLFGQLLLANLVDIELDLLFQGGALASLSYSRAKEQKADLFGLDTLVSIYGHAGGATELFDTFLRIEKKYDRDSTDSLAIFHTHPLSTKRRAFMERKIRERGYRSEALRPLKF